MKMAPDALGSIGKQRTCAGSLYAMMLVTLNTPATPSWFGSVLGAVLLLVGFVASFERRST
jgi:hypothetical protein